MNKGKWVIVGMVVLALATSVGFILGQQTGRTGPAGEPVAPTAVAAPAAPAVLVAPDAPIAPATPPAPGAVAGEMDAATARLAAVRFLKGDPYGATDAAVNANIVGERLERNAGEGGNRSAWIFSIRVAPDVNNPDGLTGEISVDAKDGTVVSHNLPYLD